MSYLYKNIHRQCIESKLYGYNNSLLYYLVKELSHYRVDRIKEILIKFFRVFLFNSPFPYLHIPVPRFPQILVHKG